jgi:hypothetical protein
MTKASFFNVPSNVWFYFVRFANRSCPAVPGPPGSP